MTDSALPRDPLMPRRPKGMGAGLGLAILAHLLLILAIAFGVNWRAHEPAGIEAELWAAVPQAAAPRAAAPEPQPTPQPTPEVKPPPPPPPPPKAEEPPPKPAPDPQIAIEKAKREEQQKLDAKRLQEEQEQAKREKAKREEQKREEAKREEAKREQAAKEEQERKKQAVADAAKAAAAREAYLKRMQGGLAGATGGETSTGTAMQSSGPSASYAGRIIARILPNIIMTDAIDGDPKATVEVKVAPDGKIIGRRLLRSSGVSAWDDAVLRAIDRTDMLPRDVDGRVPPVMELTFNPKQVR
jgi:colicin import membrane protein